MTWTTGPDCPVIMRNLINTYTHMSNLISTHTHTHTHTCWVRWGGYKESRPWYSICVGLPSLLVAPSNEQLALRLCWRGARLFPISRVLVPIFFSEKSVVVNVERVGFRPRAIVLGKEVEVECTRISNQEEHVHEE